MSTMKNGLKAFAIMSSSFFCVELNALVMKNWAPRTFRGISQGQRMPYRATNALVMKNVTPYQPKYRSSPRVNYPGVNYYANMPNPPLLYARNFGNGKPVRRNINTPKPVRRNIMNTQPRRAISEQKTDDAQMQQERASINKLRKMTDLNTKPKNEERPKPPQINVEGGDDQDLNPKRSSGKSYFHYGSFMLYEGEDIGKQSVSSEKSTAPLFGSKGPTDAERQRYGDLLKKESTPEFVGHLVGTWVSDLAGKWWNQ